MNLPPASKAELHQATTQLPSSSDVYENIVEYVKKAIKEGCMLPNPDCELDTRKRDEPNRRALIIAALYQETDERKKKLGMPATAHDVQLVHQMLISSGYDRKSIRILCDACKGFNGLADPTRENIMDSLEWLVQDSYPGDHRFLHFSGHGLRDAKPSDNDGTRKEARLVPEGVDDNSYHEVEPGDPELNTRKLSAEQQPERLTKQKVPTTVMYYKEAIMTRLGEPRDGEDPQNASRIWDQELNGYLSKLHAKSTITCVIDCCASGRILNLPHKALGAGFRGGTTQATKEASPPIEPVHTQNGVDFEESAESTAGLSQMPGGYPLSDSTEPFWEEELPEGEQRLNGVTANIFHWSGCHQRQNSHNSDDSRCSTGLLTREFTDAYRSLKLRGGVTHRHLYERVSKTVHVKLTSRKNPRPQFVQLWTVFKEADEESHNRLLDSQVVF